MVQQILPGNHHMPQRRYLISRTSQWLLLSGSLFAFGMVVFFSLLYERSWLIEEQKQRLASTSRVLDENISWQLEGVSNALYTMRNLDVSHPEGLAATNRELSAMSSVMPGVRTLIVFDAGGRVLASNRESILGQDFSKREYFRLVTASPDNSALYVAPPFETALGVYSMNVLRVRLDEGGSIDRIVSATLDPDFFKVLLSSVLFSDDMSVTLAHNAGLLALRVPERQGALESDLREPDSLFSRHTRSGQKSSVLSGENYPEGAFAWAAFRTISPESLNMRGTLVVSVARDPYKALHQWRHLMFIGVGILLVASIVSVGFLRVVHSSQDKLQKVLDQEEKIRRDAEEQIRYQAYYDHLTQLPNRRLLLDRMAQVLTASVRHGRYSALLFMDLDGFKQVNDRHGHEKGDQLLISVAHRLQKVIRTEDTAARWAGDEFVVLLGDLGSQYEQAKHSARAVAEKILAAMAEPHDLDGITHVCTISVGIAMLGGRTESLDDIVNRADDAMYLAKNSGKNSYHLAEES